MLKKRFLKYALVAVYFADIISVLKMGLHF